MAIEQNSKPPEERWGVSAEELRKRENRPAEPGGENERICPECGCRVTLTSAGREVGHAHGFEAPMCPNHPDSEDEQETDATALTDF